MALSTSGISITMPGPFGRSSTLPNRRTTSRWYSGTTLRVMNTRMTTMSAVIRNPVGISKEASMLMPTGFLITAVIVVILVFMTLKVVPEYQRLVVLRLGKVLERPKGPGIVILIPLVDKAMRVDLREKYTEIPHQTCITKDNASISVDFLIYSKVVDPIASFVQVQDFDAAAEGIAVTTLRAVVGDIALDDVLAKREEINHVLQTKMDQVTTRWGVKITTVEIREITPPKDILDAMGRQMSAERSRRATVTEAVRRPKL